MTVNSNCCLNIYDVFYSHILNRGWGRVKIIIHSQINKLQKEHIREYSSSEIAREEDLPVGEDIYEN